FYFHLSTRNQGAQERRRRLDESSS
ncbi:hypothetical protein MIMGU_mgv1a0192432mg, partial [Erythranthe guttata]